MRDHSLVRVMFAVIVLMLFLTVVFYVAQDVAGGLMTVLEFVG